MQTSRASRTTSCAERLPLSCCPVGRPSRPHRRNKEPAPPRSGGAIVSPEIHADGKITFRLRAPKAEKVSVICEAVGTQPMTKDADGVWSVTVGPVPPGIYDCQFDVDGLRITDPASPNVFGNRQGSRGYVEVPGPAGHPRPDEWRDVPHGTVTIHWYTSKATGARRRVHVYAPPGYAQETAKRYPVLYLLHGSGDNDSHWTQLGRANVIADNLLADGRAVPMLIVMPDGHVADRSREREAGGRNRGRELFEKDLLESVRAAGRVELPRPGRCRSTGGSSACRWAAASRSASGWDISTSSPGSGRSAPAVSGDDPVLATTAQRPRRGQSEAETPLDRHRQGRLPAGAEPGIREGARRAEDPPHLPGNGGKARLGRLARLSCRVPAANFPVKPLSPLRIRSDFAGGHVSSR